ncbi:MAG: transglutaminase family protein [Butyrivibrio sp.]|nr:transglutaminase family protein [Butyrivibrio sp.]
MILRNIFSKDCLSTKKGIPKTNHLSHKIIALLLCITMTTACGSSAAGGSSDTPENVTRGNQADNSGKTSVDPEPTDTNESTDESNTTEYVISTEKGSRDNTSVCLVPSADGTVVYSNEAAVIDASNADQGYIIVQYIGSSPKVKLQVTGPDTITYTYSLAVDGGKQEVFPLPAGDGTYQVNVFENIEGNQYSTAFSQEITIQLDDQMLPFLYPNQYVNFSASDKAIALGEDLALSANNDLDVVSNVYNYVVSTIKYDYAEAESVQSGYIPDIDEVLETKKGICLDYAALMTSILRSQRIPSRMEVGYAGSAYHAWLSTYIEDVGWVNGIIEFDGTDWSLMDPTFASNTSEESLKNFIGDGENYTTKYIY